ncbi:hypothetical protein GF374_03130 [Candidatus Woesearchaeota archaeon]|nr:hypothetical protein [Candidatus Woesearchaeota archaeon]
MLGAKKNKEKVKKNDLFNSYKNFCYRLIGKKIEKKQKNKKLDDQLRMANMKYTSSTLLSVIIITGLIVTFISFILYFLLFNMIIKTPSWIFYVIFLTAMCSILSFLFLPLLMKMRISSRKLQIDQELPFTLSELSVLASTGITPIKIVRHMAQRKIGHAMQSEFKKIVHKIDIEGKDIVTAIGETAKETPSDSFRENLWDLSNMIHQGGDLDAYLRQKADNTMQLRRDIQKEFTEKLSSYSEMYISLVLIGILFIGIAAFLLDALRSTMGPFNADTLLTFLAYGLIPLAVIVVGTIISTAYSRSG